MDPNALLTCPRCEKALEELVPLPCTHEACKLCLAQFLDPKMHTIKCPVCFTLHEVVGSGNLPASVSVQDIVRQFGEIGRPAEGSLRTNDLCCVTDEQLAQLEQIMYANLSTLKASKEATEAGINKYFDDLALEIANAKEKMLAQLDADYVVHAEQINQRIDNSNARGPGDLRQRNSLSGVDLFFDCQYTLDTNDGLCALLTGACAFSRTLHSGNAVRAIRVLGTNSLNPSVPRSLVMRNIDEPPGGIQRERCMYPLTKTGTVINEFSGSSNVQLPQLGTVEQVSVKRSVFPVNQMSLDLLELIFPSKFLHREVCLQAVQAERFADLPLENTAGIEEMLEKAEKSFDPAVQTCENIAVSLKKCHFNIIEHVRQGNCPECSVEVIEDYNLRLKQINKLIKRIAASNDQKAEFLSACKAEYKEKASGYVERLQDIEKEYLQEKQFVIIEAAELNSLESELNQELIQAAADQTKALQFRVVEAKLEQDIEKIRKTEVDFLEFENFVNKEVQQLLAGITELEQQRVQCISDTLYRGELLSDLEAVLRSKPRFDQTQQEYRMLYNALLLEPVDALIPPLIESAIEREAASRAQKSQICAPDATRPTEPGKNVQKAPQTACGLAICEYEFKAESEHEICLILGEKYWVFEISDWAVLAPFDSPNVRGVAPWNHLKPINCQNMYDWSRDIGAEFGGVLVTKKCMFDFVGEENGEITLKEGDVVENYKIVCDGWAWGRNRRTGEEGRFPKDYVA